MINQKANRRICIVYLVLFCVVFVNSINISTNIERAMLPNFSLFCEFEKKDWQHFSSRCRCFRHFDFLSLAPGFLPHSDVAPPGWAPFAKSERDVWKRILWHMSLLPLSKCWHFLRNCANSERTFVSLSEDNGWLSPASYWLIHTWTTISRSKVQVPCQY